MPKKIIAMVLAFLCLFQFLPSVGAFNNNKIANASYTELDELAKRAVKEIVENREEKSKYFELDNGQIMKVDYPVAVHKCDENGNWQNSFEPNRKNFVEFGTDSVKISRNGYEISVSYEDSLNADLIEFDTKHKVYKNIYENVDLDYKILQNKLEENLVLNSKDTQKEFVVNYFLQGLTANQIDDKNIELINENQKCVYTISVPKMIDSNDQSCENLSLEVLENEDGKLKIKIVCDKDWIESEERLFPIFVDPDYKDENFDFTSDANGKVVATNWRKKDTNTSVFLNLTGSDFKDFGVVTVSVFGKGPNGKMNCTYQTEYYLLEAGKKYELYNSVNESGCTEVQIRFRTLQGQIIRGKWSPDYKPESGVLRIGGTGGPGNIKDAEFSLVVSPSRTCWTMIRTKANDSSIYLQLLDPSGRGGSVKCSIWGLGGSKNSENCTYRQDSYTLQFGQKYELLNSVKEKKHSGVQLRIEGNPGTEIRGKWSPDYVTESGCIRVPSSKSSVIRPVEGGHCIRVQPMTQHCGFPSGCEATSAAMMIHFYGYRPGGHYKNLITDFISKMDIKPAVNGGNGPDPNFAFAGHPTQGGYGCFAPCISKAMEKFFKENARNGCYAEVIRGKSLAQLAKDYTARNVPILIWATINMSPKGNGNSWKVTYPTNSPLFNKNYIWPAGEHCVVLVGFNERDFFVNDPHQDEGSVVGAYSKSVLETSFESMGSQAIVVHKESTVLPSVSQENILKFGTRGEEVRYLQNMLLSIGYNLGPNGADGIFGKATETAVRSLQTRSGISADGRIGPQTVKAICGLVPHKLPTTGTPGSVGRQYGENGELVRERFYGPDGKAEKDIDYDDHDHPESHDNPHEHEWDWENKEKPRGDAQPVKGDKKEFRLNPDLGRNILVTGAAIGTGYVIYRGARMLISTLPPLWWTIPFNVAIP